MFKKTLLSFLTITVLLSSSLSFLAPIVKAQEVGPWYNQNPAQWYTKVYDDNTNPPNEIFGERYTAAQVQWIIYSVLTFPLTLILKPATTACILKIVFSRTVDITGCFGLSDGGPAMNQTESLASIPPEKRGIIQQFFDDRPLSGITYIKNIARDLHLVPEASAQTGFGYSALSPLQTFWTATRNITYGFMILIILVMAFMIMFRTKISPQTVITIQSSLPKIVIALLLITFSYAIAGFAVDLMYVVIGVISVIGNAVLPIGPANIYTFLTNPPGGIFMLIVVYLLLFLVTFLLLLLVNLGIVGGLIVAAVGAGAAAIPFLTPFYGLGLFLVLLFVLLMFAISIWNGIKAVWELVKAFTNIIILVIFGPFQIALGTVMNSVGFGSWLRSLIANLAVFVVTGVLLFFSYVFMWQAIVLTGREYSDAFSNPFTAIISVLFGVGAATAVNLGQINSGWPPFLGGGGSASMPFLFLMVSFVFWTLVPHAANLTKAMLTGKPFAYGTAIGQTMTPITAPISATWHEYKKPVIGAGTTFVKTIIKKGP